MTPIASTVQAFFTERLIRQRQASAHTIAAYRDVLRLLLGFAADRTRTACHRLDFADIDASTVSAFLDHLENERGNSVRTRNARLAAIHSLFTFAALRHPEHADDIARVLAIPPKRGQQAPVAWLTADEAAALISAPDQKIITGRRDRAMLALAIQTGLRASELAGLTRGDVHLGVAPHVTCQGKGRKQRITPLTSEVAHVVRNWLAETPDTPTAPVFPSNRGTPLSLDALSQRVGLHASAAARTCPSLAGKHVTPHVLRHSAAMALLHAGVETTVIALWLGHANVTTTGIYLHADLEIKQRALDKTAPPSVPPGRRYQPTDQLLAFLQQL